MAKPIHVISSILISFIRVIEKIRHHQHFAHQEYAHDEILCVMRTLDKYIAGTERWISKEGYFQLLLSFIRPHKSVVSSTITGCERTILMKSGVNAGTFKAHSARSASTSQAGLQCASTEDILKQGSWSNKSIWRRFYNKNIVEKEQIFEKMVFKSA